MEHEKTLTSRGTSTPWHVFFARQQLPRLCQLLYIEVNNLLTVTSTNLTAQTQVRELQRQDTPDITLTIYEIVNPKMQDMFHNLSKSL